jgi:hypothetical protein
LLSLRPEPAKVAAARSDRDVIQMRPRPGRAAFEIALDARLESGRRGRLPVVIETSPRKAERLRMPLEQRRQLLESLDPRRDEHCADPGYAVGPRSERVERRQPGRDPPERGIPLPDRGRIFDRNRRPSRCESSEHPIEISAPHRGRPFDNSKPIGSEHERSDLGPKLLGGPQPRAVHLCLLRRLQPKSDLELERRSGSRPTQRNPTRFRTDPDHLCIRPRPRRETLRAYVDRFEQIRFPDAVRADDQDEAGLKSQLEPLVRADARERDRVQENLSPPAGSA